MCKWSGHNVRVVRSYCASEHEMCEQGDVRVIGYVQVEMCEWSGHNVRVNMKSASREMCE